MNKYRFNILILYLFHFSFVFLSYYLDSLFIKEGSYTGFHYLLVLNVLYFIWAKFSKLQISTLHIFILGFFFIGTEPSFENDHYRYLWEGKVISHGFNPYKLPPRSKNLKHIEYQKRKDISYNKLTSIYPPLAQVLFLTLSPFKYRVAFSILQLLGLFLLVYIVFNLFPKGDKYLIFILPYLFKEFVQAVHIDILAFFVFVFLFKKNRYFQGIFFAFQVKVLSIIAIPFLLLKGLFQDRKVLIHTVVLIALIGLTLYLYPSNMNGKYTGAGAYIKYWSWNSLPGALLIKFGVKPLNLRYILLGLFSLSYLYLVIVYIRNNFTQTWELSGTAMMFLLICSPVLHPWYMFWPFLFMRLNKWYYYFLASSVFAYYPYGNLEFKWIGELIQFILLMISIHFQLREIHSKSSGAKISIWFPSGSRTEA